MNKFWRVRDRPKSADEYAFEEAFNKRKEASRLLEKYPIGKEIEHQCITLTVHRHVEHIGGVEFEYGAGGRIHRIIYSYEFLERLEQ